MSPTAPDKVEAAARRLVADDATYISLNFDNRVAKFWTIEDFSVTDLFGVVELVPDEFHWVRGGL